MSCYTSTRTLDNGAVVPATLCDGLFPFSTETGSFPSTSTIEKDSDESGFPYISGISSSSHSSPTIDAVISTEPLAASLNSSTTSLHTGELITSSSQAFSSHSLTPTPPSSASTKSGLVAGEKAGIAIGAILGVALIACAAFLLGKRLTKKAFQNTDGNISTFEKAELAADEVAPASSKELSDETILRELPANEVRAELEGSEPAGNPNR